MLLDKDGNEITEETVIPVDDVVDDHMPTDEELSDAFDNFVDKDYVEPVVVPDPVPQAPTETPEQIEARVKHSEDSRLGRRLARVETMFEDLSKKILTKDDLKTIKEPLAVDDEIEDITNVADLDKFVDRKLEAREHRIKESEERTKQEYQDNYLGTMKDLISDIQDEQTAREVYKEMLYNDKFNVKLSNDSIKDSARNFNRAYSFVISKSKGEPTRFDKPRVPGVPTGVSNTNTNHNTSTKVVPKLDADAAEFARQTGMTDEDVIDALEGEMPLHLRGKISA
jgi:hypothetical protein